MGCHWFQVVIIFCSHSPYIKYQTSLYATVIDVLRHMALFLFSKPLKSYASGGQCTAICYPHCQHLPRYSLHCQDLSCYRPHCQDTLLQNTFECCPDQQAVLTSHNLKNQSQQLHIDWQLYSSLFTNVNELWHIDDAVQIAMLVYAIQYSFDFMSIRINAVLLPEKTSLNTKYSQNSLIYVS